MYEESLNHSISKKPEEKIDQKIITLGKYASSNVDNRTVNWCFSFVGFKNERHIHTTCTHSNRRLRIETVMQIADQLKFDFLSTAR